MSALLDLPEFRQRISRLSIEEYHRLDEYNENGRRTELIRGIVIEKMSKSPLHSFICSVLYKILLEQIPANYTVWKEEPLTLFDSEPEPDISITPGSEMDFRSAHPETAMLVIELAVSSAALDRENASLYAEAGITEYWIILAATKQVEVYRNPSRGSYETKATFGLGEIVDCLSVPGIRVPVSEIFPPAP